MSAVRLARGATGRAARREVRGLLPRPLGRAPREGRRQRPRDVRDPGLARRHRRRRARHARSVAYNDLEAVGAVFAERGEEVACVIVEPVAANMGVVPPAPGFLDGLRDLCSRSRRAPDLRRGDHRVPPRLTAGAQSVFGVPAGPHDARQGDGRRLPVRRVRRPRRRDAAPRARRSRLPGGDAEREPGRRRRGHRDARPRASAGPLPRPRGDRDRADRWPRRRVRGRGTPGHDRARRVDCSACSSRPDRSATSTTPRGRPRAVRALLPPPARRGRARCRRAATSSGRSGTAHGAGGGRPAW